MITPIQILRSSRGLFTSRAHSRMPLIEGVHDQASVFRAFQKSVLHGSLMIREIDVPLV